MTARTRKKKPARKRAKKAAPPASPSAPARSGAALVTGLTRAGADATVWCGKRLGRFARWAVGKPDMQRACALGLMMGTLGLASHIVRADVESWPRFSVSAATLSHGDVPVGLSPRVREDLARLPLPHPTGSFDRRLVPFTAALLQDLEWIEEVHAVQLDPPASLRFSLRTRLPVALLGENILTADAAVIGREYAAHPEVLPRVRGVPEASGEARQLALAAAASVLDDLGDLAAKVDEVDVSGLTPRDLRASGIVLTLARGLRVEWGRPSADERPHLSGESKRGALEEFLESGIDLLTVERVSLLWDETTYVLKPAAALASAQR